MFSKHLTSVITDTSQNQITEASNPTVSPALTSGWHCVLKHLIELAEVHDHGEFVWLYHRRHLLASHAGRNAKFPLRHVETQLVVLLLVSLVQGIKVTEGRSKTTKERMRWDGIGAVNAMTKIRDK